MRRKACVVLLLFMIVMGRFTPAAAQTRPFDPIWHDFSSSNTSDSVIVTSKLGPNRFALTVKGKDIRVGSEDQPLMVIGKGKAVLETVAIVPGRRGSALDALNAYRDLVAADLKLRGWNVLSDERSVFAGNTAEPRIAWGLETKVSDSHIWLHYAATVNGANIVSLAGLTEDEGERAALNSVIDQAVAGIERRPGGPASAQEMRSLRERRRSFDYSGMNRMILNGELATNEDRRGGQGSKPIIVTPSLLIEVAALALVTKPNGAPFMTFISDGRTQHVILLHGYDPAEKMFEYSDTTGNHSLLEADRNVAGAAATRKADGLWSIAKDQLETVLYGILVSSGDVMKISRAFALGPLGNLGKTIEDATKTDFFTYFNLSPVAHADGPAGQSIISYKPTAPKFAPMVTVKLYANRDGRLTDADLVLKRKFIEDPENEIFARDIAQSFLLAAAGEEDGNPVHGLHDEIFYLSSRPMLVGSGSKENIGIPIYPSEGYLVYAARRVFSSQMLQWTRLWMENVVDDGDPSVLMSVGTTN